MIGTMTDDAPALRTHRRPRRLATELVGALSDQIRSQRLRPGDKLPTELKIMEEFGVSRTVVREAISGLQSAGLVETKHGIGTFVLDSPRPLVFRVPPGGIPTIRDIQAMLEVRLGLESEAAAFAAERPDPVSSQRTSQGAGSVTDNAASGRVWRRGGLHLSPSNRGSDWKSPFRRSSTPLRQEHDSQNANYRVSVRARSPEFSESPQPRARADFPRDRAKRTEACRQAHAHSPLEQH